MGSLDCRIHCVRRASFQGSPARMQLGEPMRVDRWSPGDTGITSLVSRRLSRIAWADRRSGARAAMCFVPFTSVAAG